MLIGDRSHNGTYGKAIEIVIDKDKHTQKDGCKLGTDSCFDML